MFISLAKLDQKQTLMNRIGLTSELGSIQAFVNIKGKSLFRESKNKIFGNGMVEQVISDKIGEGVWNFEKTELYNYY